MFQLKLDKGNSKKYKVKAIYNNTIYIEESEKRYLPGLYYKSYLIEKNI